MKLPARVRLSRLPGPPGDALLSQMRRLDHTAPLDRLRELPSSDVTCIAVIAGGKLIGFLLAERGNGTWHETLTLEPTWRGKGIEEALRAALTSGA